MIRKVVLGALAALALVLIIVGVVITMQPDEFTVTRSASFNAPPERLFEQVNDFHKWDAWSPWAKLEPAMKTFTPARIRVKGLFTNGPGTTRLAGAR